MKKLLSIPLFAFCFIVETEIKFNFQETREEAFYIVPYNLVEDRFGKMNRRVLDIDKFVDLRGKWSEIEIEGNESIVKVVAEPSDLSKITYKKIRRSEVSSFRKQRKEPRYDAVLDTVLLDGDLVWTKTLAQLDVNIKTPELIGFNFGISEAYCPQIGFPTTPILDNFNRTNEGPPPSSNWTADIVEAGDVAGAVVSNECQMQGSFIASQWWNLVDFGPDSEIFVTFSSDLADELLLYIRMDTPGTNATLDGYFVDAFPGANSVDFFRIDNGTETQLGSSVTYTFAANDVMGVRMIGSTLEAFDTGVSIATRTDATHTAAGAIGMVGLDDTAAEDFDDFGGGSFSQVIIVN